MISAKELLYIYLAIILTALLAGAMIELSLTIETSEARTATLVSTLVEKTLKEHIDGCS